MNKQLIILLAVCLLSVHAFVKRDAEAAKNTMLEDMAKHWEEFTKNMKDSFDPEHIKKEFGAFVDKTNEVMNSMKPSAGAPK